MTENKTIGTVARQAYEPIQVKVMKVTPRGILCQSGGGEDGVSGDLREYNGSNF